MQVLAGPRQVGKSTLVEQVLQNVTIPYSMEVADAVDPQDSDSPRVGRSTNHDGAPWRD